MPLIAIVDDNDGILDTLQIYLQAKSDYEIRTYDDPQKLLDQMHAGLRPDFVVTDFYMFGMNGVELLDTIAILHPDAYGIIMTGYPEGIASVSRLSRRYPILCKGSTKFFRDLIQELQSALVSIEEKNKKQLEFKTNPGLISL